ncbi:SHOCT domain-containing protein [Amycolatopsis sp. GM8]|uniref:SHOCT domain-containing protein n=1 Tax=Amycolatopsis sp. GM8 TaxID=2896530 RepID=UPI001F3AF739|nr:SHOCT domain-containing protein [Amycolatopsis sp. GM8]
MFWHGHGFGGWGFGLTPLLFWLVVIIGIVVLTRYLRRGPRHFGPRPTPEQLLAERFARGEISEDAYRRALDTLHRPDATDRL